MEIFLTQRREGAKHASQGKNPYGTKARNNTGGFELVLEYMGCVERLRIFAPSR
jgi:hypothetical protein